VPVSRVCAREAYLADGKAMPRGRVSEDSGSWRAGVELLDGALARLGVARGERIAVEDVTRTGAGADADAARVRGADGV